MAFTATKRELGELYTFFHLMAKGEVAMGNADGTINAAKRMPIAMIQREEHDGTRRYFIQNDKIEVVNGTLTKEGVFEPNEESRFSMDRADVDDAANFLLDMLQNQSGESLEVPDAMETFLNEVRIYDLEAQTQDRTDVSVAFWSADAPLVGFSIRCRLAPMNPLLDGGRTANLKFEQSGVKFATPTVNKVNALPESPLEVMERMLMIERLGGVLKYSDVADKVFRCNLLMIDLHFPRLLAEMVRSMHLEGITKITELVDLMKEMNPLKVKDELIQKHGYYEYKVKQFLVALALGMRPAKIFNGSLSAVEGILWCAADGSVRCYHRMDLDTMSQFLFTHTRLEKGALEKDKYGFLEKENGVYYFKLNAKIGWTKK